jgi:hypothetical protein
MMSFEQFGPITAEFFDAHGLDLNSQKPQTMADDLENLAPKLMIYRLRPMDRWSCCNFDKVMERARGH